MEIVIDGYNLLKNIFHHRSSKEIDKLRDRLIYDLGNYKNKKNHTITIVFDGGEFSHATREVKNGVIVIFSGYKQSADDWIIEYMERYSGREFLLISNDRKLIEICSRLGSDAIDVEYFYKIVSESINQETLKKLSSGKPNISVKKYSHEENMDEFSEIDNSNNLDLLIAQSDVSNYYKDDFEQQLTEDKKGKFLKASKSEKKVLKKLNKL